MYPAEAVGPSFDLLLEEDSLEQSLDLLLSFLVCHLRTQYLWRMREKQCEEVPFLA